ncbi:hypothetical protein IVB36_15080 [Bradyrhizobium sp. 35]|uniref:hypothetical protein n=1 Tax=Bradyrhizobium sp. 35 TaxID=2782670 RepID=UPI001FF7F6EE|nr:hypothetical protein [Bradyrhizobium sp. 35]MCK1452178.1 hypothetical protein [Bradyrhizobium sp. 35]
MITHKNYNPRTIRAITDTLNTEGVSVAGYPDFCISSLDRPNDLWEKPFKNIPDKCQHLLIGLFFCSGSGSRISDLRLVFDATHAAMCEQFRIGAGPKDFEEALKIMESGFVAISSTTVSFINPSLRDYLQEYLKDIALLKIILPNWLPGHRIYGIILMKSSNRHARIGSNCSMASGMPRNDCI